MVALLMFAAGFALGLFFGWLLHRERVERAVYEDVARNRDRATAALAETSARLELANKDMIRLRSQLTDAEHELDERDEAIAELQQRVDAAGASVGDAVADAAGPAGGDAVALVDDWVDADDRADVTEEVALAATRDDEVAAADAADAPEVAPAPVPAADAPDEPEAVPAPVPAADAADAPDTDAAESLHASPAGVQEPLASLLDVDPEPPGPEDDAGDELTTTDTAEVGALASADGAPPTAIEPAEVERADVAPEVSPVAGPAVAVGAADRDLPTADPVPDAVDRTDDAPPDPVVAESDELGDAAPDTAEQPGESAAAEQPGESAAPERRAAPAAADATEQSTTPPEPVGDDAPPVDAAPGTATPDDLVNTAPGDAPVADEAQVGVEPVDVVPVDVAPDGAAPDRSAVADDLRRIAGVGPALERALHAEGITTFTQIADLDDDAIADLAARQPRLVSRLRRDGWVAQARRLQAAERPPD